MSTRSRIGKLQNDGTVKSIYCHWDGYIENNGKILVENYKDEETVDKLLDLGDMSSLGTIPEDDSKLWDKKLNLETMKYDYNSNACQTYKGRGETGVDAKVSQSVEDYLGIGEEYNYLFKDGEWYVDYVDEDAYEHDEDDIRRMDKVKDLLK